MDAGKVASWGTPGEEGQRLRTFAIPSAKVCEENPVLTFSAMRLYRLTI